MGRNSPLKTAARALAVSLVMTALMPFARAEDKFISVPVLGAIMKIDGDTGVATTFASGLGVPFYGFWTTDGKLYMPDREFGVIFEIDDQGTLGLLTAGGLLSSVVTVAPDPNGGLVASDLPLNHVVHVAFDGTQTLVHDAASSGGLISGPGGLAYAPNGDLYVANNIGNSIVKIAPDGAISLFSTDPLISQPGGIAIDNAGNMFVAQYSTNRIVRFRLDTGVADVFAENAALMTRPNDVKLARSGGLLTTSKASNLLRVDSLGNITEEFKDLAYGEIVGVNTREDATACSGSFVTYGGGTPGAGGHVPFLRGIFNPCPGHSIALEFGDFLGGTPGALFIGFQPTSLAFVGGTLLVDPFGPFIQVSFPFPGAGPGDGDFRLPFVLANEPALVNLKLYLQAAASDAAAPGGVSLSNGLEETIGS